MSSRLLITHAGKIDSSGFEGTSGHASDAPLRIEDLRWSAVSDKPYKHFGRLDALSKCAVAAAEIAGLEPAPSEAGERIGIAFQTVAGCVSVDVAFQDSIGSADGPSPRLFAYTLPSIGSGAIAIRYGYKGPNTCIMDVDPSGFAALHAACALVWDGEADACLALTCDAVDGRAAELSANGRLPAAPRRFGGYALMVQRDGLPAGAIGWIETIPGADSAFPTLDSVEKLCATVSENAPGPARTFAVPPRKKTDSRVLAVSRGNPYNA